MISSNSKSCDQHGGYPLARQYFSVKLIIFKLVVGIYEESTEVYGNYLNILILAPLKEDKAS